MINIPDNISQNDNVFDVLKERGFVEQVTDEDAVRDLLSREKIRFYIGFDPTADCLHVGHFMQIIILSYMLKYGHTPVALIGGGTGMIGDPSGRTDMRKLMDTETIDYNCAQFKKLFDRFLPFDDECQYVGNGGVFVPGHLTKEPDPGKAISVNNGKWLRNLNFVEFMRTIGKDFNVNTMLRSEAFKQRMARENGLSFFEFGYMLMQGYDFYVMARDFNVQMEFGGNDQWSNIIAGINLTKKEINKDVYGMTFSLLTNSEGKKMGKTGKGALWLSADRTSPYEFYQYWRNVGDLDVNKCLRMLTFLPMDEVERLSSLQGSEINKAKEVLAYEVTKMVHGEEEAEKAQEAARSAFGGAADSDNIPTEEMKRSEFAGEGKGLGTILKELGLASSNSDARRTIEQGGVTIDGEKITDKDFAVREDMIGEEGILIRKGKKKVVRLKMK